MTGSVPPTRPRNSSASSRSTMPKPGMFACTGSHRPSYKTELRRVEGVRLGRVEAAFEVAPDSLPCGQRVVVVVERPRDKKLGLDGRPVEQEVPALVEYGDLGERELPLVGDPALRGDVARFRDGLEVGIGQHSADSTG